MPELVEITGEGTLGLNFHPGQWKAWNSQARFVAVLAGTQSGKTSFSPHWLYREIQRRGPGDYLFVTPTYPLLELKALPEIIRVFERWLALGDYVSSPRRVFRFSKSGCRRVFGDRWDEQTSPETRILFGYATDPESLESATVNAAVCDEAGQKKFPLAAWEAILRRLSLAKGRVLITTSAYSLGWLSAKYDAWRAGDKDWEFITFDSKLNPAFPADEFERAQRDLPKWKFDMLYRGLFTKPAGLIYDCYERSAHRCPSFTIPRHWKRYVGIDFGQANMAAVFLAEETEAEIWKRGDSVKPGKLYVYRTYHAGGKPVEGHVRALKHGEPEIPYAVGGALSEDAWRQEFKGAGLPVRRPKVAEVQIGIDRVYGALQRGQLVFFDDLAELDDELLTYSRVLDERGQPTEEIEDKETYHLLDALRYVIGDIRGGPSRKIEVKQIDFYPAW